MPELTEQEVLDILGAISARIFKLELERHRMCELRRQNEQCMAMYPPAAFLYEQKIAVCESKITTYNATLNRLYPLRDKFKSMLNKEVPIHVDL